MSKKYKILVVDDNPDNVRILVELLKNDYQLNATTNGFDAIYYAASWQPDLILLDIMMPEISGYNVCIQLKNDPETQNIPIIFVTALADSADELLGLDIGAIDYITKPIVPEHVKVRVRNHIELKSNKDIISETINYRVKKLDQNESKYKILFDDLLQRLSQSNKIYNIDKLHSLRCFDYTKIFLQKLIEKNTYPQLLISDLSEAICCAALFHDAVKDKDVQEIVLEMLNRELFDNVLVAKTILQVANSHHEYWNGKGRPEGLSGNDIPLSARIFAVVDFYDRKACGTGILDGSLHFESIKLISSESTKRFDPDIVYMFSQCQDDLLAATAESVE